MGFNELSGHRWAVCTCAQLAEAAMESRVAVGVIFPRETCNHTSRDVIRESKEAERAMEERRLRTKYSEPCFHKQCHSLHPQCEALRLSQQFPRILFCRVTGPLEMLPLYLLWTGAILECPQYLVKRFSWRGHASSTLWSLGSQHKLLHQLLYHMSLKAPFRVLSKDLLRDLRR